MAAKSDRKFRMRYHGLTSGHFSWKRWDNNWRYISHRQAEQSRARRAKRNMRRDIIKEARQDALDSGFDLL